MRREAVSVIGGADGPTSIFIARRTGKKPFRERIRQCRYRYRRKREEQRIRPVPHTLEEVLAYAAKRYHVTEIPKTARRYEEEYQSAREGLIVAHRPELLGDLRMFPRPEVWDETAAKEIERHLRLRRERIAGIPEEELPMDFHLYEIRIEDGWMELDVDFRWGILGMSYSGSKKTMKKMKRIARELYLYYGVSREDMANKTPRYQSLLNALSN